jgi:phosphatidate cytidylyltransferase
MNSTVKRTLSGTLFLAIMLGGLLVNKYLFAALFAFMTAGMLAEFFRMTMGDRYRRTQFLATATGVIMFVTTFLVYAQLIPERFVCISLIPVIVIMAGSLHAREKDGFPLFTNIYTGLFYIALPLTLSNLIVFDKAGQFSGLLMVCFFCIIWASDVGAYCFGLLFGKNGKKLCPEISPKKSWAGFWGGLLCAVLAAVILRATGLFTFPYLHCIILAVIMDVAGVYGDLFESQWKRIHGLKDSGNIIPGHGGLLDRFDSTIFAIPLGTVYLVLAGLL